MEWLYSKRVPLFDSAQNDGILFSRCLDTDYLAICLIERKVRLLPAGRVTC